MIRNKTFNKILKLLPQNEEIRKITTKFDEKAKKTADFMSKFRNVGIWIARIYFIAYWAIQSLMDLGAFF